jgi:hypothetical protein
MSGSRRTPSLHCRNLSTVRADVKLAEPTRSFSNLNCDDAFDPDSAPENGVSRLDEKDQPFFSKTRTFKALVSFLASRCRAALHATASIVVEGQAPSHQPKETKAL